MGGHRDVAVEIRTVHRYAEPVERAQQLGRGMAVVVVQADADHADAGVHRPQERRVEVGRAVVWHLEHVGAQVDPRREHRTLSLDLDVSGQQDPHPAGRGAQHERGVVRIRSGVAKCRSRPQNVEAETADPQIGADRR